ncbi:MAG: hypothetical protein OXN17_18255 [Candidatus Poribacteria bacterium]|nr:hypothetical protein [Candidatus Poribacteria bacterium]
MDRNNKFRLRAKSAGQDAPPTDKVDDMIQTSYDYYSSEMVLANEIQKSTDHPTHAHASVNRDFF